VQREVAALFRRLTSGVYVVGVAHGGRRNAFTAAWITQVSFDPLLLALAIHREHASFPLLAKSGAFAVSVLERGRLDLARAFGTRSGRDLDKLAGIPWHAGTSGAPVLDESVAFFDCRVVFRYPAGDHELVVGAVVDGAVLRPEAEPMRYVETGDLDGSEALYPSRMSRGAEEPKIR
jgi:flavin reductase (DIM6/NTAB) family NADH-FMN oxidoreductase RutF